MRAGCMWDLIVLLRTRNCGARGIDELDVFSGKLIRS